MCALLLLLGGLELLSSLCFIILASLLLRLLLLLQNFLLELLHLKIPFSSALGEFIGNSSVDGCLIRAGQSGSTGWVLYRAGDRGRGRKRVSCGSHSLSDHVGDTPGGWRGVDESGDNRGGGAAGRQIRRPGVSEQM